MCLNKFGYARTDASIVVSAEDFEFHGFDEVNSAGISCCSSYLVSNILEDVNWQPVCFQLALCCY